MRHWTAVPAPGGQAAPINTVRERNVKHTLGAPNEDPIRLRKAPLLRSKRQHGAFLVSEDGQRIRRWAAEHDACIDCGTAEQPHRAHGRCTRGDDRWRYRNG